MNNALAKMKIGILCGGWSDERSISLNSGNSVYDSLINRSWYDLFIRFSIDLFSNFIVSEW